MPRLSHTVRWAVLPIQLLSIFAVVFLCCPITADGAEWVNPSSGVWDDPGNWSGGEVPNGSDAEAVLGPVISGPTTVTVDSSVDLNALLLGSPDHTYTIAGSGQLSFIGPASIDVVSGTHTIAVPILGNQQVTKRGEGTLRLEGDHEIQGVLRLEGGKLESQVGSLSVDQLVTLEGELTLGPGKAVWSSQKGIEIAREGQGTLTIAGGSRMEQLLPNEISVVGYGPDSVGEVLVTGSNSAWILKGIIVVGINGTGRIRVEEGARFESGRHVVGSVLGEYNDAEIVVTGAGSRWTSFADVYFGYQGATRLLIEAGGHVEFTFPFAPFPARATAYFHGPENHVTVSGEGSLWSIDGDVSTPYDTGSLTIEVNQGGAIESWQTFIGPSGKVSLTDPGSRWDVLDAFVMKGGELTLKNGATMTAAEFSLGQSQNPTSRPGGDVRVLVTGAGTKLTADYGVSLGRLSLSSSNVDQLTLSDGAQIVALGIGVLRTGLLTGHGGTIVGHVTNSGIIAPGNSPGALTIDGNFTQFSDGHLAFEIAGPESYDQLVVTGHASLAGTMSIELLDGYVPELGTTFTLFDFGSADGELTLEFPRLGGGLGWDTRQLISDGVISVAPMSAIPEPPSLAAIALAAFLFAATVHHKLKICNLQFAITWDR